MKWLQHSLEVQLGNDVAFGTPDLRRQLGQALRSDLTIRSEGRKRLRHVIDTARAGYLERWQSRVASPNPPGPERAARAAAAHLDAGHSQVGLRRWLTGHAGLSAVDLMSEAAVLSVLPPQTFRVWVPVLQLANIEKLADHLPAFSRAEQLEPNIKAELANLAPKGFVGAFAYEVEARDAERAVELVVEVVERMRARSRFAGAPGRVVVSQMAYVETETRAIELRTPNRGASIASLVAEGQLLAVSPSKTYASQRHSIDDALELAAPLNSGALAPAISGSWAALEALLTDAQDGDQKEGKVVAALHASRLTACSWPRAELTALSYQVDPRRPEAAALRDELAETTTNRERSLVIAKRIERDGGFPLARSWRIQSDAAAINRMQSLLDNPTGMLTQVGGYVEASFRRLYRCRNVIVHGGSTRGDVLDATLRVTAPLIGATLDRLTHAHLVTRTEPLQLAALADFSISTASDTEMGPHVVDLLGRD